MYAHVDISKIASSVTAYSVFVINFDQFILNQALGVCQSQLEQDVKCLLNVVYTCTNVGKFFAVTQTTTVTPDLLGP